MLVYMNTINVEEQGMLKLKLNVFRLKTFGLVGLPYSPIKRSKLLLDKDVE